MKKETAGRLRLALLAVAVSSLVLGTEASCTAGSLQLDLLSTGSTQCNSNLHALCLSSFSIGIDASCNVALTPLLAAGVYAPGIWSSNPGGTYTRLVACPTWTTAAVDPDSGSSDATSDQLKAAIKTALEQHVYGTNYTLGISSIAWSTGVVTVNTVADSCALKYAITQVSPDPNSYSTKIGAEAVRATCGSGSLSDGTECKSSGTCGTGKRPVSLASGVACAVCRAGTISTAGTGCTSCTAGQFIGSVGQTSCSTCTAGSYSLAGYSQCLPCSPGTYQSATGQSRCLTCPSRSYAQLPGATQCVSCVAGVATCVAGDGCSALDTAPSPGYQVLAVTTSSTLPKTDCNLPTSSPDLSYGNPALFGKCALSPSGTTLLSVYVDEYCKVQLSPMTDTACAEPGASYWSTMLINAHYVTPTKIASFLDTTSSNLTSSYLLTLVPLGDSTLTLSYWPATTDASKAAAVSAVSKVCSGTVTVTGGQVVGKPTVTATCPAGSYNVADVDDGCRPCPVGSVCALGSTTPTQCTEDQYQPYLGRAGGSCLTCSASANPRYTSEASSAYCDVLWVDTTCANGQEYDASSTSCVTCPAGTARLVGTDDECTACALGYYSAPGASTCSPCPINQFSPVVGLGNRTAGTQKCLYCPTGSVAKTAGGALGQTGSVLCDPCPPGTYATIVSPNTHTTCEPCADGYYRSGDASAENNVCEKIPPGYKEKSRSSVTYTRAEIELCSKGEVSYWTDSTRTPNSSPQTCQPCSGDNTYGPRTGLGAAGLTSCRPCPAGTYPSKSDSGLPGNDICVACSGNTYRPASSTSATCLVCTAGKEVASSKYSECLPCEPGFYMPDNTGGTDTTKPASGAACLACPVNTYQPSTGRTSCIPCAAGSSTQDTGNTACQACPIGQYSPSTGTSCISAPKGAFVNTTGATIYTLCPAGMFSSSAGVDSCDVCGPGQYSSSTGATACQTCPPGKFSASKASACRTCGIGFFSLGGSSACSPCKPGAFSSRSGATVCTPCTVGNQCPTMAMWSPQPCPRGHFSNKLGNRLCTPCPPNTYQNQRGQRSCLPCSVGFNTRGLVGQSACSPVRPMHSSRRLL